MIARRFRAALAISIGVLAFAATGAPARAALVVYDPSNFSQNVLTAARSLQQIANQITSLQNEAQMLLNQARNLASLPYSALGEIQASIGQTQQLLRQAQRIAYDMQSIDQAFRQSYPQSFGNTSGAQLIQQAEQRWQNSVAAFQDALHIQAGVVGNLTATQAQTGSLITVSQGAVGVLQATQAGNQLIALQTRQLADLTAVVAAQGRAQALEQARRAEAEAQAREQLARFLTYGQGYQPQPVQMFH
jgi:P-type conjugative transfer protein TrbJ